MTSFFGEIRMSYCHIWQRMNIEHWARSLPRTVLDLFSTLFCNVRCFLMYGCTDILDGYVGYTAAGWLQRAGSSNKAGIVIEYCGHISVGGSRGGSAMSASGCAPPPATQSRGSGVWHGSGVSGHSPVNQPTSRAAQVFDDSRDHAQREMEFLRWCIRNVYAFEKLMLKFQCGISSAVTAEKSFLPLFEK